MKLLVKRFKFLPTSTIGRVFKDGVDTGLYTLEDKYREVDGAPVESWKIEKETAIPKGEYKVTVDFSNHFNRRLPLLVNVPGYEGVRIHPGNTDKDTEGCLLVGDSWAEDFVGNSRASFEKVFEWIEDATKRGEPIEISVE